MKLLAWPDGSTLTASDITYTSVTLNWTPALDLIEINWFTGGGGYPVYGSPGSGNVTAPVTIVGGETTDISVTAEGKKASDGLASSHGKSLAAEQAVTVSLPGLTASRNTRCRSR